MYACMDVCIFQGVMYPVTVLYCSPSLSSNPARQSAIQTISSFASPNSITVLALAEGGVGDTDTGNQDSAGT